MEYRDRTEMKFVVDEHLQLVLEYIQLNVPVAKLIGVSERLPELARLLWGHFQQEPVSAVNLELPKPTSDQESRSQLASI